jgi:3-oxoacyl-[acyl-carrier protein] reductase
MRNASRPGSLRSEKSRAVADLGGASILVHNAAIFPKGGIIGFIRSLAREIGPYGVTINGIAPGLVRSHGMSQAFTTR